MKIFQQLSIVLSQGFLITWLVLGGMAAAKAADKAPGQAIQTPPGSAIASAHPLATAAGFEVIAAGGNAFDAAVAVSAALAVVEPHGSGLGGGGFWLLQEAATGRQVMIDGRERAPLAARRDLYLDAEQRVIKRASIDGPLAAAIPGMPAALDHLASRYGRLPLAQSLAPAIRLAQLGFNVDARMIGRLRARLKALRASPAAVQQFLPANQLPELGYRLQQPDLANTLRAMATRGRAGFYAGDVGDKLVRGVREAGGIWTAEDLRQYRIIERDPIVIKYQGMSVVSAAPPSSGGVALASMLNMLSALRQRWEHAHQDPHVLIEVMRRAYRDRSEFLGDPDFYPVPVERLVHPWYAQGLVGSLRKDQATRSDWLPNSHSDQDCGEDTTHFSILDAQGNRVAATLSINYGFGSGFVAPGTGVILNDEMDDFSIKPGVPNVYGLVGAQANEIAPGKRPLSSMTPTFLESDTHVALLGTPGGSRIITMVLHAILAFEAQPDAQLMVSAPRYHHQYLPDRVQLEPAALTQSQRRRLTRLGHQLKPMQRTYGNMQVVVWDKQHGTLEAASDPRGNGAAGVHD